MIYNSVFIDTWGWLTLACSKEKKHTEVKEIYKNITMGKIRIYTSNYVIDELITLLFRRTHYTEAFNFIEAILKSSKMKCITIEQITEECFEAAWVLRKKFSDKPDISFTDFTSMALMQGLNINHIITDDRHFFKAGLGFELLPENF